MILEYGFSEFGEDLTEMGLLNNLQEEDRGILMSLLDGSIEAWVDYLGGITDVFISIEPNLCVRRINEVICVFEGKAVKIENKKNCAWEDYNGSHFFTNLMRLQGNSEQAVRRLLDNFRQFIKTSGLVSLKERTKLILPAWSVAFVHRMPDEVQAFYFPRQQLLQK